MQTVEFAPDHHAVLCAVTGAVLNDHMDADACDLTVRTGDMEFPCGLGIMLVQICALHDLLYNESAPITDICSCTLHDVPGRKKESPVLRMEGQA